MKMELWKPLDEWFVNQGFGENATSIYAENGLKGHPGIDLRANNSIVRAAHDGEIVYTGDWGISGYIVILRTHDKREYQDGSCYFETVYCHLRKDAIYAKAGQKVEVGSILALSGASGKVTGPHLHFGLIPVILNENYAERGSVPLDPLNGFRGYISPTPFLNGKFAKEGYLQRQIISILKAMVGLLSAKK